MKSANLFMAILVLLGATVAEAIEPTNKAEQRVVEAARVIDEIMTAPDKGVPRELLSNANCVAVIPSMKQGGFIFGARHGKGVMTCRNPRGSGWTGPSTIRLEGGSFRLQIGDSATDIVAPEAEIVAGAGSRSLYENTFQQY